MSATDRTKRLGLKCPDVQLSDERFLTKERMERFPQDLQKVVGEISIEEVVAQCLYIHHKLQEPVSNILGTPTYFTIGYVETAKDTLFYHDENSFKEMLHTGLPSRSLNIHAWLTLPSMEVFDFSLPTSYAIINEIEEGIGGLIAAHADALKHGMKYHPMLVGKDFLRRIGALVEF